MHSPTSGEKTYEVDKAGHLVDPSTWDKEFAVMAAPKVKIPKGLTSEHWDVISFIRDKFKETAICPTVYETCRATGFRLKELRRLFPTGYLRGACLLAGITYRDGHLGYAYQAESAEDLNTIATKKIYETDVRGFLVYPDEWDEYFAVFRAHDMKIPGDRLTDRHWLIIRFLRETYLKTGAVPTVYDACEKTGIEIEELEKLFPDGYHRGAVKIAGLRVL